MRAGDLRHRITIQEETATPDGMGGETLAWGDQCTLWAAIWPLSAKESLGSMKLELKVTHRVRIRYRPGITSKNRIKMGVRFFDIVSLINYEERNVTLDFLTNEVI